ncbi:MAG: GntR family transcriptional regulator [Gammaproteobacteria bacterium]|nr:GntR family transcriptional regulator [Gammaproteobacteria bacterium]NVK86754.1 GntR family transcriptional regulator [Gammaproteobacteria bacterium]
MVKPGQINTLVIVEKTPFGAYLNAGNQQLIFARNAFLPEHSDVGDAVEVFIFQDNDGKLQVADPEQSVAVGKFARLTVVDVNKVGAFVDWGMSKDLLIPFAEQSHPLKEGQAPIIYVYRNKADQRVVGSTRLDRFLDKSEHSYKVGDAVTLMVLDKTDLGIKVIVDHLYSGLIHHDDCHQSLKYGDERDGFIKNIRADNKLDISLNKPGIQGRDDLADKILRLLDENDGLLRVSDKSSPELIKKLFNVSKKQYKMALGKLYKDNKIEIAKDFIKKR